MSPSTAQTPVPVVVRPATGPITLDGRPDEAVWLAADSITDFTQREPDEGHPATERTVVRLLRTPSGLFVAVWAYDGQPGAIRHTQLRHDAPLDADDAFTLVLDPLRDRRSGFEFSVNANGARRDAEIVSFENTNTDWDGVWDARARRTAFGWTAELWIPWQTLRYARDREAWGVNFGRFIRRKNEEVLWRAWARPEGIDFLAKAGVIAGFRDLPARGIAELRPYVSLSADGRTLQYDAQGNDSVLSLGAQHAKVGGDAKLAVAPTLTLDLTANTDFAQVEVDDQVLNLTRFPLFFPEKRPFFLESSGIFDFGQSERTLVFYSRRIGLDTLGATIPLTAGARLTGRLGHDRLGVLAVRTGGAERAVDWVGRLKHDVLQQGYVGAIISGQSLPGAPLRLATGVDANLPFVVHGQNLVLGAFAGGARAGPGTPTETAWRVYVDFPNDAMDHFVGLARISPGFDPPMGFVEEADNTRFTGHFDFFPRPHHLGIRRLHVEPLEWETVWRLDGGLSHAAYQVIPLGAEFNAGDQVDFILERAQDNPSTPFEIFPGDTIAPGRYAWNRIAVQYTGSAGRAVSIEGYVSAGQYYTGDRVAIVPTVKVRAAPHVVMQLDGGVQNAHLQSGRFVARFARFRLDIAASPRLGTTLFVQSDNESRHLTVNARFHWIIRPGSDAYLVYNSAWPTGLRDGVPWGRPSQATVAGKLVYYFKR
jgi:hypothetical protein